MGFDGCDIQCSDGNVVVAVNAVTSMYMRLENKMRQIHVECHFFAIKINNKIKICIRFLFFWFIQFEDF